MLTEPAYDEFLDIAHARQQDLVERVKKYDTSLKEEVLNKAFLFAISRHRNQYRASGEPYYSHPIEVASILIEYRLDWVSIVTALLHDTVEDGVATYKEIYKKLIEQAQKNEIIVPTYKNKTGNVIPHFHALSAAEKVICNINLVW